MIPRDEIVEEFRGNVINEYLRDWLIPRLSQVEFVSQTDGTFTQIALRPQVPSEIFDKYASIYRGIVGFGNRIAIGEAEYFLETLSKDYQPTEIKFHDIAKQITEWTKKTNSKKEWIVLASRSTINFIFDELETVDSRQYRWKLNGSHIHVILLPEPVIKDLLFIYDKKGVRVRYAETSPGSKNPIQLTVNESQVSSDKVDVLCKSVVKIDFVSANLKIFRVKL